jgi:cell wall-associated NlpC family hydrolase
MWARRQLGKSYVWAADGPDTFDCSGLTQYVWAKAGVYLPHSSRMQFHSGRHISKSELRPGDLVFYGSPIHHVGIYIGGGMYINAPQTGDVVKISSIYRKEWAGAVRL